MVEKLSTDNKLNRSSLALFFGYYIVLSRGAISKMAEKNPLNLIWVMPAKGREKKGFGSCSRGLFL
jgi:hypothetical protein